jgi:phosphatidylinositol-3-phosphatase
MLHFRFLRILSAFVVLTTLGYSTASAQEVKTVFVIAMENHNWTQPTQVPGGIQQIFGNTNAPFINSLVNGTAFANINGSMANISQQVAYATAYHNVLATPSGNNPSIHPSEPNYLWAEAGTNFGIFNDADPYPNNNQNTSLHLSGLLTQAGKTWRSYQEDIDLDTVNGALCNDPQIQAHWTVPLVSFSGIFGCGSFNAYNLSTQYNYAAKHNPMVFFTDTNGGDITTPANLLSTHYAPLQQLLTDLANNTVADYNWITPDQYNDMHSGLTGGFQGLTGDAGNIAQGDNFLSQIVPIIMASNAYKNHGVIILWWDESETDGVAGDNANDFNHTIGEIIISGLAHPNVNGLPYASPVNFTHSSDLRTMQNIFHVGPYLGDAAAATTNDLSDLFKPGSVPMKP